MMREETDEEIVREAIGVAEDEGYTELYQDAIARSGQAGRNEA